MTFPLSLSDISLWLGFSAIVVLVTSELINLLPEFSPRIMINRSMLRTIGMGCGVAFIVTIALRVLSLA